MANQKSKILEELKKRAEREEFTLEKFCFDKQLEFLQDTARFKTAVCSRRCLAEGTLVQTTLGPKKIEDIKIGDYVYSENGDPIKVLDTFYNGKKEVFEFTHNGRVLIEATLDHKVLTSHNRIKVDKVRKLYDIYKGIGIKRHEILRKSGQHVPYAYALGALLGDGCSKQYSKNIIYISSKDSKIPEKVCKQLGGSIVKKNSGNNYTYALHNCDLPEEYLLWCKDKYAHEKICDVERIMSWDRESRLAFVAGLLDTDGSVSNFSDGIRISIRMQAKSIIDCLKLLFLDLWNCDVSENIDNRSKYVNGPVYGIVKKHNYFGKKILKELDRFLLSDTKKWKSKYETKIENNYNSKKVGIKRGTSQLKDTYDIHVNSKTNLYTLANGLITHNSGKSVACAADLVHTALNQEGDVAYLTLNRRSAKRIIWRAILEILDKYEIPYKPDNVDLSLKLKNNNIIYVSGAKDEMEIEKLRGISLRKVYIDECQAFRAYIEYLVDDILEPALTDYDGSLILIGTPGPVPAGFFYNAANNESWSHHSWTMHDNPWIHKKSGKDPELIIEERCKRRGITKDDPSIQREYYGKWTLDNDSLVYKFNKNKNIYQTVPINLKYVIGVDIGYVDSDAIAVLGYSSDEKNVYLVQELITEKQTISDLADQIKSLMKMYNPVKMVMDAGALGKKIQEEIRQRHKIHLDAAEKARKLEFIELLNDDLRTGRFLAFEGSRFQEDSQLVSWDYSSQGKPKISDTYHTDIGDAILYAWRECRHFLYEKELDVPKPGTDAYMDMLEELEAKKLDEKIRRQQEEERGHIGWSDEFDPYEDEGF